MFNSFTALSAIAYRNKIILAVVCIVVVALILDTSLIKTSGVTTSQSGSVARVDFFVIILSITIIGQFLILGFVREKSVEIRRNKELRINTIQKIVTLLQSVITGILIFIILQIVLTSQYNLDMLIAATAISYSLAIAMMVLLTRRFFSWLKPYRNSVILSYCLASAFLVTNIGAALFLVVLTLPSNQQQDIVSHFGENIPFLTPGSASAILDSLYDISSILSFIMMWIATCILLRHYSRKFGKVKFWILVSIPLIYFLSQFLAVSLNIFGPLLSSQSIFYGIVLTLIFTFSESAGGILFGVALWTVTRHISKASVVRDYMIISAFGLVLLFSSNQASVLLTAPYPPFGLASASFVGLSSYLVLVGIYSSAISVAQDTKLRQTIRQSAIEETKLLVSIGSAQMEQEIQRRVLHVAKQQEEALTEETGIHPSLTENDMRNYLSAVLEEIRVLKNVDEILIKGKEILEQSTKFLVCSKLGQIRLVYNNYFDLYEKVMYKYTKAEHEGIRLVTSIDSDSVEIVRKFLDIGIQIKHVKNMPPIDFAVSDQEMVATIEKTESSQMIQNLLVSSEKPYIDHFASIFEELWKNGIDAKDRVKAIEEGIDTEGIEIIQNPAEIQKYIFNLLKSATDEILVIFSTANAFHRQEYLGAMQFLKEAANERGANIRILTPADAQIMETAQKLGEIQQSFKKKIHVRFIEPDLQTKVSILTVDRKLSLTVELKDDTSETSHEAMGLATYSNSKPTVLSYVSIFESLWKQTELYERLKDSDKIKDEFINIAAHELRTPIQPILGLTDILRSNIEDPGQQEMLDVVIRNARRLQRLTEDILDATKIESRALRLKKEKLNLNEIILNAISDTENQIGTESKYNRTILEFVHSGEKGEEDATIVEVDKGRITQVISNLLTNATKFTENGTIKVFLERKGNEIVVSVKDTGTGIDAEIFPRLFTKFSTKSNTGTGLGLFISKSVVEAHGGKIWAENNADGRGAKFSFSLPITS